MDTLDHYIMFLSSDSKATQSHTHKPCPSERWGAAWRVPRAAAIPAAQVACWKRTLRDAVQGHGRLTWGKSAEQESSAVRNAREFGPSKPLCCGECFPYTVFYEETVSSRSGGRPIVGPPPAQGGGTGLWRQGRAAWQQHPALRARVRPACLRGPGKVPGN